MINKGFYENLINDFTEYIKNEEKRFAQEDRIRIDLHCHDRNSDIPDEQLGRILGLPETWLETSKLAEIMKNAKHDVITITNHNNARSCYDLANKGFDVLTGAEFSVTVPDFDARIHVLAYGFTPEIESKLKKRRNNLYRFMDVAAENAIPTIWAHPLFFYSSRKIPSVEMFNKLAVVFERFEAVNGQRDTWQNMLVKTWVDTLTPEKISEFGKKHRIPPDAYCSNMYRKTCTGGSDEHMGIFTGLTGSYLHVPDLNRRRITEKTSVLALEALRKSEIAPFGSHHDSEKMMVAFIDYFCQIGMNIKDPGLLRMILHKGETSRKLTAFFIANSFFELGRHRLTSNFLSIFHNSLLGQKAAFHKRYFIPKIYRPLFDEVKNIASLRSAMDHTYPVSLKKSIETIFTHLNEIIVNRIDVKINRFMQNTSTETQNFSGIIKSLEIPSNIRSIMTGQRSTTKSGMLSGVSLRDISDGLSFPLLASSIILGATYTAAHVLYNSRPLLCEFSEKLGKYAYPKRMLWLSDTFEDNNGVSTVLQSMLFEIRSRKLPIDICVCSSTLASDDNLIVLRPLKEYELNIYNNQPMRLPDIMAVYNLFKNGEYDRVISSTEGFMGLAALFLKKAYSVPAYFYIHTDWMTFARKVMKFDKEYFDRIKRLLRIFYSQFDGLFVLNREQQKTLTGSSFNIKCNKVHLTAHWTENIFRPAENMRRELFNVPDDTAVIIYAGRLSAEKGVFEIPGIYKKVSSIVKGTKIVFTGTGPAEEELKKLLPDAIFTGWVEHSQMPQYYSSSDMLILPSKFDTFGCVIVESLSCGTPVAAYKSKGPKDIIIDRKCGYLSESADEMAKSITAYLKSRQLQRNFRKNALKRASYFTADTILAEFMTNTGLS